MPLSAQEKAQIKSLQESILARRGKKKDTRARSDRQALLDREREGALTYSDSLRLAQDEAEFVPPSQSRFLPDRLREPAKAKEEFERSMKEREMAAEEGRLGQQIESGKARQRRLTLQENREKRLGISSDRLYELRRDNLELDKALTRLEVAEDRWKRAEEGSGEEATAQQDIDAATILVEKQLAGKQDGGAGDVDFSSKNITLGGSPITGMQDIVDFVAQNPNADVEGLIKALSAEIPEDALRKALQK